MLTLKVFPTHKAARAFAEAKLDQPGSGYAYSPGRMELLDEHGNYTRLGVIEAREDADRYRGVEWDAIDWTDSGPIDGAIVAMLQAYVGRRKRR